MLVPCRQKLRDDNIMIFVMEVRQVFSSISSFGSLKIDVFRVLMQNIKKMTQI